MPGISLEAETVSAQHTTENLHAQLLSNSLPAHMKASSNCECHPSIPNSNVTRQVVVMSRENVLKQLKEATGVNDIQILKQALEASRNEAGTYDIVQAANFLVDENAVRYNQNQPKDLQKEEKKGASPTEWQAQASSVASTTAAKPEDAKVIDLTSETSEKEELQKAIALSLQDQHHGMLGGQVTAEEQDISMVLEQSLADSKLGIKRKRGEVWQDPLNPYERKRQGQWPVGLKNVGNTCWFSAVIQSLFQLPVFRHLVLNFVSPVEDWDTDTCVENGRNLRFMKELRNLFALMVGSQRKYVDPSRAVEIFKEAFQSGNTDSQQDVSEFTHKLLEWLEDAFKSENVVSSSPSGTKNQVERLNNPMLDLFYGQFRSEGLNEGHVFSKEEKFGQYPLQVNGFGNIHDSLEAATAQEIESNNIEAMTKSGQEHWFTQLPPALLFELSRFQFNQQLGKPEKIHNHFDFPEIIYMDRYMENNKEIVKSKREDIKRLKHKREEWQNQLDKFLNFGSGSKRFPLLEVLKYTLEFAESKPPLHLTSAANSEVSSVCNKDLPSGSSKHVAETSSFTSSTQRPIAVNPAPGHISETELRVLQNCLRRWRTEAENNVKELQDNIKKTDDKMREMYSEQSLLKVPYRLHAVLVHEGQAASGHYWAYVYDHSKMQWLKFNDVTVTNTSWEELQKESFGGYHNASAYCLMYIDSKRKSLVTRLDDDGNQMAYGNLPFASDIKAFVEKDNEKFRSELAHWDNMEQRRLEAKKSAESAKAAETVITTETENHKLTTDRNETSNVSRVARDSTISQSEAVPESVVSDSMSLTQQSSNQAIAKVATLLKTRGGEDALKELLHLELKRYQKLSSHKDLLADARLQHITVYLLANDVPVDPLITCTILEQFTDSSLDNSPRGQTVRQAAIQKFNEHVNKLLPIHRKGYHQWQEDFKNFRKLAALFITGLEEFHSKRYLQALPYLVNAVSLNDIINKNGTGKRRGLDNRLLSYYRRQCLLNLNNQASQQFESNDPEESKEAIQLMNDFVVPCMNLLSASAVNEDDSAAEEIRSTWCSKLGGEEDDKKEFLADFLRKLLDPSTDLRLRDNAPLIRGTQDLAERFTAAMNISHSSGYLDAALQHSHR